MKRILLIALLLAAPVSATQTDLTGTWSGSFDMNIDGNVQNDTAHMVLKQKGDELTGTVGPNEGQQWPISAGGKFIGGEAKFDVQSDGPLVHFTLKLVEGHLKGDANAEMDGRKFSAKVDVQRKK
jgi:hypothetical protein